MATCVPDSLFTARRVEFISKMEINQINRLLNQGDGDFSRPKPISLPGTSCATVGGIVDDRVEGGRQRGGWLTEKLKSGNQINSALC